MQRRGLIICSGSVLLIAVLVALWQRWHQQHVNRMLYYECRAASTVGAICPPFEKSDGFEVTSIVLDSPYFSVHHVDPRWSIAVKALFQERARSGGIVNFLVLGAAILDQDTMMYKLIAPWTSSVVHTILVEPIHLLHERLKQNLEAIKYNHANTKIVDAAICAESSGNATLRIFKKNPLDSSTDAEAAAQRVRLAYNNPDESFETVVPCLTVADLVKQEELQLSDIDILHMDLEGSDIKILQQLLPLPDFTPRVLVFEWSSEVQLNRVGTVQKVLNMLSTKGYDMHQDGMDIVAIANRPT